MIDSLKWLLKNQRQHSRLAQASGGFTLIELLIATLMAALVITPLLGFMINLMNTDNKEQAKATSEREIQSALDFIAQDLEQAVYIYDADGLGTNSTTDPATPSGIKDQIPPEASASGCGSSTCVPVLVLWKREFRQGVLPGGNDIFVYSLVAYYLIEGNNSDGIWSDAARIGRFQIRNEVRHPTTPTKADGSPNYIEERSKGFQLFNLNTGGKTLEDKMNRWKKKVGEDENYTDKTWSLVDFIDKNSTGIVANCPANTQITSTLAGGFYACVDSSRTLAQIYIRGNALARINKGATCNSQSVYCPSASIQIKGRGLLGVD